MTAQQPDIVPDELRFLRLFRRQPRLGPCTLERIALLAMAVNVYSGDWTPEEAYDHWLKKVRPPARRKQKRRA
jgi:hypothetical protein